MVLSRVRNVPPSGPRKIFDMVRKVKDPVNLILGDPHFEIPLPIKQKGIDWVQKGFNKYIPSGGIPELREKLLGYLRPDGIACDDAVITAGVIGSILLALLVTVASPGPSRIH